MKQSILKFIFFSMGFFLAAIIPAYAELSIWEVLRAELQLNHQIEQSQVQAQIHWLTTHPSYFQGLAQAKPYLYHIVSEIKKRHLPGELALIPMIESTYDPFAYSNRGAAGLWQIMPATGDDLGLQQNWWVDSRRNVRASTNAALNYLSYLRDQFQGNWPLAIAAYDAGEGTIGRAVKTIGKTPAQASFWALQVPQETKNYVPRLLALAEIVQNPARYHIQLPDILNVPFFEEVTLDNHVDLPRAAKLAGVSYRDLMKLNPGYNRWTAPPHEAVKLLIPTEKVADFYKNLALMPRKDRIIWIRHQMRRGETLERLAQRYFTTVKLIKELNRLSSSHVATGKMILVPSQKPSFYAQAKRPKPVFDTSRLTMPQTYKVLHIVQDAETLGSVARRYHVTEEAILQWNSLPEHTALYRNQQLLIWKNTNPTVT